MKHHKWWGSAVFLVMTLLATEAGALEDCSAALATIDKKIAAARSAGQNVEIAEGMKRTVSQSCAFLDQQMLDETIQSLDMLFPALSAAEEQVETLRGLQESMPAPPKTSHRTDSRSSLAQLKRLGTSLGGRLLDRPDRMNQFAIWDLDILQGKARVAYQSRPTRDQFGLPDWEYVTYVVEIDDRGVATQSLIRRGRDNYRDLALRRRHDQMLILLALQTRPVKEDRLELWSVSGKSRVSGVTPPAMVGPDGKARQMETFQIPTSDGNVIYAGLMQAPGKPPEYTLVWVKTTPAGKVTGRGSITRPYPMSPQPVAETPDGRAAFLVRYRSSDPEGVDSRLDTPIRHRVGGRDIHANVASERRLLVIGDDATAAWESDALERMLAWNGDLSPPRNLDMNEMMRQSEEQRRLMAAVDRETHANRRVESLDVGLQRVEMLKPLGNNRYAALARVSADRRLQPPVHGQYLLAIDRDEVQEWVYLQPLADSLDVKFTALEVSPRGEIYLLAVHRRQGTATVVRIGRDGSAEGYVASTAPREIVLEGLVADDAGVWLFGHGFTEGDVRVKLWSERLPFGKSG
ncbi:MAG TPA: hypothetical protein ENJ22_05550 [Gammaproteobacteria bacterium]|nr:hypothetical protein [Gammaproteobacteria bacterium]